MQTLKNCLTCDTYQLCKTYDRIPPDEGGCDDWEPARLPENDHTTPVEE